MVSTYGNAQVRELKDMTCCASSRSSVSGEPLLSLLSQVTAISMTNIIDIVTIAITFIFIIIMITVVFTSIILINTSITVTTLNGYCYS